MTLEQLKELGLDEEIAKKILEAYKEAIKDKYVPIERFNEVNEEKKELKNQLEDRDKQLQELKVKAAGNEELTAKITELEELNKQTKEEYENKIAALKKETAIELKLKDEKARNIKAVKALLDLDKVSLDGDNLIGLDEQLKGLKESDPYLFGEDKLSGREPKPPTDPVPNEYKKNPFSKEHFNLTEQGRIFRENPELAAKLKAAAEGK
ncbi:phage scaffolding protein [Tepidimicrobium xylanilyticum]|uniref:Phage minor structural protein GP20 n=1 Tax=Tepidimicrobium xylanilyticum TaxID=1123352 RepID=A0A1H3FEZ1_9FIRM|nr:phage scaffolding protein [Tepidimicrobium xylanilyticum]SDX89561.1 Phage minor structural protein GP20 [Tepidimicrobium xylanilyticum]